MSANLAISSDDAKRYVNLAASVINHASQTMSSLQIAEITGKRHDAVLRDVRNILEQGVDAHNFVETSYTDKANRQNPCFMLTKTGCLILASGYNALLREKIINRWIELETANQPRVPTTFREALLLAAAQQGQIEEQQKVIEEKTQQLDESKEWFSIKRWAQIHHKDWRKFKWRKLKAVSYELGYAVKKIFDANYGEVNIYHRHVFEAVYGKA